MTAIALETDKAPAADRRPRLADVAKGLEEQIRQAEGVIENERRVPQELTDAFYEAGIYRAFMPRELGGLEVHPIEWLEAVEEVSRINGSMGWLCMLHTGATFAPPAAMHSILQNEKWITAGNLGRAAGKAYKVEGGYRISGRWPFCSGSPEATYLFGRSVLYTDDDQPVTHPVDGLPWYITAYFPARDVTLHDTWDGTGLRGTGSGDIEVKDLFVPSEMVNEMGIWELAYDRPLYRANFNLMAHAAHSLGLARAAIEEFTNIANRAARRGSHRQRRLGKEQIHQIAVGKAQTLYEAARAYLRETVELAYADAHHNFHIDYKLRARMHQANVFVVHTCKQAVDLVFAQAGSSTVFRGQLLERINRDMIVASQHLIITESSYDRIGQYLLTRDLPGGPEIDVEGGYIRGPHPHTLGKV